MRPDYRNALKEALGELEVLLEKQEQLEAVILSWRKTVNALSILCDETGEQFDWRTMVSQRVRDVLESSITDDVLKIVWASRVPLTSTSIKDEMEKVGGLEHHKNPLATINAVLSRLQEQKKVERVTAEGGRIAWKRWKEPSFGEPQYKKDKK